MNNYDDIINLTRPDSKFPKMNELDRASQFAPFAALTGYNETVLEVSRRTDQKIELDDGLKALLNDKLNFLKDNTNENVDVEITYFIKDKSKPGGKYETKKGIIRLIDNTKKIIYFKDKTKVNIEDIINIKSSILLDE